MKQFISALFSLCLAASALGDNHGNKLFFEPRQDSTTMSVTSVSLTSGGGQINAVGDMGEYGRVYTTYTLAADTGGMAGNGSGRGSRRSARWDIRLRIWLRRLFPRGHDIHNAHFVQD